jgi:hypothetical protein
MVFAAALGLLVVAAFACAFALRLSVTGTLLAAYLFATAEVVAVAEALSPFHAIGVAGYLSGETVIAAAALTWWLRAGSPRPSLPRITRSVLLGHPLLLVLGAAVGAALALELVLATTSVPNEWDSLTYHMSRVAAWYQHGSLGPFTSHTLRESVFPINAELQVLFTVVLTGTDRLSGLPQFLAELTSIVAIFGIARRLGFKRSEATFASLLFATFAQVALEATTPQNDLVVTALVLACVYFVLGARRNEVMLAAASLALAFGTKFTAFYAVPVVLVVAMWAQPRRRLVEAAAAFALAFAALGSVIYVSNAVDYGNPVGPRSVGQAFVPKVTPGGTVSTTARILWKFVDFSGYNADIRVRVTFMNIGSTIFDALHIKPEALESSFSTFYFLPNVRSNEDVSFFGPIGMLLIPLLFGYTGAFALRKTSLARGALGLALPAFLVELALTYRYTESIGRFMILPVALGAALLARVYATRVVGAIFVTVGVVFLGFTLLHSERKPVGLTGTPAVWSLDYGAAQALVDPHSAPALQAIDAVIPPDARVGVVLGVEDFDYPLYGRDLSRRVIQLPPSDPLEAARQLGLQWVVIGQVAPTKGAPGWVGEPFPSGLKLITPAGSKAERALLHFVRTSNAVREAA